MSGSSPSHSISTSVSTSLSVAAAAVASDDNNFPTHVPTDPISSAHDRKDDALRVLKTDLMAALQKEVKSLDEDSWKFSGPRSQIHRISKPGTRPILQYLCDLLHNLVYGRLLCFEDPQLSPDKWWYIAQQN